MISIKLLGKDWTFEQPTMNGRWDIGKGNGRRDCLCRFLIAALVVRSVCKKIRMEAGKVRAGLGLSLQALILASLFPFTFPLPGFGGGMKIRERKG